MVAEKSKELIGLEGHRQIGIEDLKGSERDSQSSTLHGDPIRRMIVDDFVKG